MNRIPWLCFLALMLPLATAPIRAQNRNADTDAAWAEMQELFFNEARDIFDRELKKSKGAPNYDLKFGKALSLLNAQPRTQTNIQKAKSLFSGVADSVPDGELGIASRYFMGRIAHIHQSPFDWAEARQHYESIIDRHPEHFFAQAAVSKIVLITLYEATSKQEKKGRYDQLEAYESMLTLPVAKKHFHFLMGEAALRYGYSIERALHHFLTAEQNHIIQVRKSSDVTFRIAELARALGKRDLAIEYYRKLLRNFFRDSRRQIVLGRLAELNASFDG